MRYLINAGNILSTRPRGSAVGERLWSDENLRNVTDATIRLHSQRCRMIRYNTHIYLSSPYNTLLSPLQLLQVNMSRPTGDITFITTSRVKYKVYNTLESPGCPGNMIYISHMYHIIYIHFY